MRESEIKNIIEALLFAASEPLTQTQINNVFEPETYNLDEIVDLLNKQYTLNKNSFVINKVAGGYQIVSREEYNHYISKLLKKSNYYQFQRIGYFKLDKNSSKENLIFNKTVSLRDSKPRIKFD